MKKLKEENGYSLLLAIAVLSIFAILGLTLMTITTNGISKNKSRQDIVQATDLSDKGTEYMINDLQKYLENQIKTNNYGKNDFYDLLDNTFNDTKYKCSNNSSSGYTIPADNNSETKVCIERVDPVSSDEKDLYKRKVTFKSTGIVDGKEKTTRTTVILGTDAIPDQLKYAISTNKDGNLFLHGGVEIQGDVKADGNVILSEKASWISDGSTPVWEDSVPARIIKNTSSATPKLIMNTDKKLYVLKPDKASSNMYNSHIKGEYLKPNYVNNYYSSYSPTEANASSTISSKFFNTPNLQVVTRSLPDDSVNVVTTINNKFNKTSKYYEKLTITSNNNNNLKNLSKTTEVFLGVKEVNGKCIRYKTDRRGNPTNKCAEYEKVKQMVKSSLNIGDANKKNSIELTGTIYLNGNLKINNTNLKSDALIYVNGDVEISNSTLNGKNNNSTLIIFATGNIDIYNISLYKDTSSKIKGFFYTESDMIMYGVGSNVELQGGISARRLILTAVRGTTKETYSGLSVNSVDTQKQKNSRLKVIYDQNLISEYTEFKRDEQEEFITEINDPEIIERIY